MMRKLFSGILVVIILVVTVGVPIYRHTCHVFDRSELSLLTQKQCCDPGDRENGPAIDFKCCSLEHFETALDYETLVDKSGFNVVLFTPAVLEILNIEADVITIAQPLPESRPPPLANRDILYAYQIYLI
jgi:hypothetical protein